MKKQIASILTAALILSVLSGCSSGTEGSGANSGSSSTSEKTSTSSSSSSFSEETSNSSGDDSEQITGNFIEDVKNAINSAKNVDELNGKLKSVDRQNRINLVQVFENLGVFADNAPMTNGDFTISSIIYISYDNGLTYITCWGDKENNPIPMMLSAVIARADTIERLVTEMNGYNMSLDEEQRLTGISVYTSYENAFNSIGNPIKVFMENGEWVETTGRWDVEGAIRITYDKDKSWFCLNRKGEIA